MADATFHPGYKFTVDLCLKFECKNRDIKCTDCHKFSKYEKRKDEEIKSL